MDANSGYMQAQKIIVIHPGSLYLRIGRAPDLHPVTILHAIAHKINPLSELQHHDSLLPSIYREYAAEFEEQRVLVAQGISSYVERDTKRRVATPPQQIATYNRRSVPEELPMDDDDDNGEQGEKRVKLEEIEEKPLKSKPLFDKDILALTAKQTLQYNIHFPIRRGELNIHDGVGGSLTAVLTNLEAIWLYAIEERLGIPSTALPQYSAVLIIPDAYNRSHLREYVSLLLQKLRFRCCFLLQDHVAATFGTGLGYACVVDIGDQKCSISCVEDGISHPDTRVRLCYGGGDVTQIFQMLLRKCGFPYKEADAERNYADAALFMQLKENFCHLKPEISGAQEKTFLIKKPLQKKLLHYTIQCGDECLVAPLAFFHTELMNITSKGKRAYLQQSIAQQQDPEDCFDAEYIRETGRRNGRDQLLDCSLPVTGDAVDDELVVVDSYDERESNTKAAEKAEELMYMANDQIASLDVAIVRSIERCGNEDLKRKMYGCILLVGGSIKFPGLAHVLERKIMLQLAGTAHLRATEQPVLVNVYTKEIDPAMTAWKGAAIMSCLESASELWIFGNEWEKFGIRILREKAPFIW